MLSANSSRCASPSLFARCCGPMNNWKCSCTDQKCSTGLAVTEPGWTSGEQQECFSALGCRSAMPPPVWQGQTAVSRAPLGRDSIHTSKASPFYTKRGITILGIPRHPLRPPKLFTPPHPPLTPPIWGGSQVRVFGVIFRSRLLSSGGGSWLIQNYVNDCGGREKGRWGFLLSPHAQVVMDQSFAALWLLAKGQGFFLHFVKSAGLIFFFSVPFFWNLLMPGCKCLRKESMA